MLNPRTVVDAVVTALRAIPELVTAMGGDANAISAFHFEYGAARPLEKVIAEMPAGSVVAAWAGTIPGPFGGMVTWKCRVDVYIRMANAAGQSQPVGYEDIWFYIANAPGLIAEEIIPGNTQIMDLPGIEHLTDVDGIDRFCVHMVIPQIGDL